MKEKYFAQTLTLGVCVILYASAATANSDVGGRSQGDRAITSGVSPVGFKEELEKLKRLKDKIEGDSDDRSDKRESLDNSKNPEKAQKTAPPRTCRPNVDVTLEVTKKKCSRGYASRDYEVRIVNKTDAKAYVLLEIRAHNFGTGELVNLPEKLFVLPRSTRAPNSCATKAKIAECKFI